LEFIENLDSNPELQNEFHQQLIKI